MKDPILAGIKGFKEIVVNQKDTASAYGSGLIDVYATPAMIALMEDTAQLSIQSLLTPDQTTVGSEISVKHLRPTPVGAKVTCESLLSEVEGRKLIFIINACDEKGMIGTGTHTRYIVHREKFLSQLA